MIDEHGVGFSRQFYLETVTIEGQAIVGKRGRSPALRVQLGFYACIFFNNILWVKRLRRDDLISFQDDS